MKVCLRCSEKFPDDANFCPMDGGKLEPERATVLARPRGASAPPASAAVPAPVPANGAAAGSGPVGGSLSGFARFVLGAGLGGGASGAVFRAKDRQSGADVVVKKVEPRVFGNPALWERGQRELKQLGRLQLPAVARVIDFGKTPEGEVYVASEQVEGASLDAPVAAEGALPLPRCRHLVLQIGEALAEIYKAGLVHRDLAPKNVLVGPGDKVRLINLAVPRAITDKIFGVPEFLSPEQVEGRPVDQRSNIYSLGAIFYFLVVGAPPFAGATVEAICEQHLKTKVDPPSARRQGLPAALDRVLLKALDKASSRRHLTMRQFLSELEAASVAAAMADEADVGRARTLLASGLAPPSASAAPSIPAPAMAAATVASTAAPPVPMHASVAAPTVPVQPRASGVPATAGSASAGAPMGAPTVPAASRSSAPPVTVAASSQAAPRSEAAPPEPPPVAPTVASRPAAAPPRPAAPAAVAEPEPSLSGNSFRETLWFKKGDVEQLLAAQKAATGAAAVPEGAPSAEAPVEDIRPLEDRYVDDGSVSQEDRQKFSLRSAQTMFQAKAAPPAPKGISVPGERMSEEEMIAEIQTGAKMGRWIAIGVAVVLAILLLWLLAGRNRGSPPKAAHEPPPAAVVAAPPAPRAPDPETLPPSPSPTLPTTPPSSDTPEEPTAAVAMVEPTAPKAPRRVEPGAPKALGGADFLRGAERALAQGRLVGSQGDDAVALLLVAKRTGTKGPEVQALERRLVRLLEAKAARATKRKEKAQAKLLYAAILRIDPHYRGAGASARRSSR